MHMKYPIIFLQLIILFTPLPCLASDFSSSLHSIYTLSANQKVDVNHSITITNGTATRYPTGYSIVLRSTDFTDLKLVGPAGLVLNPTISSTKLGTEISFSFPKPIVGLGKSQTYRLTYQDPSLIFNHGAATEMVVPPLGVHDPNASISAQIILPSSNCSTPVTKPVATYTNTQDGVVSFEFDHLTPTSSVILQCNNMRYITMNLNYILENSNMTPIETQITLPPDTDHQLFSFSKIEPKPINLTTDIDGNPIATYKLEPKEQRHITVQANGILSTHSNGLSSSLSMIHEYTSSRPYWPTSDNVVKKYAHELKNPSSILESLVTSTTFNEPKNDQASRQGGKAFLTNPKEFSGQDYVDSFITLNRAINIMSRRLVGIVTTPTTPLRPNALPQHKLHVWADYYDTGNKTWVSVDPVWAKTMASSVFAPISDLSHIVLAINGASDTIPYPAGFYYTQDNPAPEITVTDINPFTHPVPSITAKVTSSLLSAPKLSVKNTGTASLYHQPIKLSSGSFTQETLIDRLPLGGQVIIPLHLPQKHDQITLTINQQTIIVNDPPFNITSQITVAGAVVTIASILAVATRRVLVSRRKR